MLGQQMLQQIPLQVLPKTLDKNKIWLATVDDLMLDDGCTIPKHDGYMNFTGTSLYQENKHIKVKADGSFVFFFLDFWKYPSLKIL